MHKRNAVPIILLYILTNTCNCQFTHTENMIVSSLAEHFASDYVIFTAELKDLNFVSPIVKLLSSKHIFTMHLTPSNLMEYVEPKNILPLLFNNHPFDSTRAAIFWKTNLDSLEFHLSKVKCNFKETLSVVINFLLLSRFSWKEWWRSSSGLSFLMQSTSFSAE